MNEPITVKVVERGQTKIAQATWNALASQADFWRLIDQKIISTTQLSPTQFQLNGSCFSSVASYSQPPSSRSARKSTVHLRHFLNTPHLMPFESKSTTLQPMRSGPLLSLLIRQFLLMLRAYVSRGRQFHYSTKRLRGSLVGGRIAITETIGLRARGLQHLVAFDRPVLTHVTPKNRIVAAAISEVERVADIIYLQPADLASARGLSILFEDCKDFEVLFGSRAVFAHSAHVALDVT